MRITIVTQEEPFYLPPCIETICQQRKGDVIALIILPAFNESLSKTALRLYEFYGPIDFSRLGVRYTLAKLSDKTHGLFPSRRLYSTALVAEQHGIRIYRPESINSRPFIEQLADDIRPDLVVSIAASQIFRSGVLQVPRYGCINLHSAPLPKYQGMMPNFWTMMNGEDEAAVTVHYMVEKLDAGDIIVQRSVPIYQDDSLHDLMVRSKSVGADAVLEAIRMIETDTVEATPLDISRASYFSFPKREDARRLRGMGHKLL